MTWINKYFYIVDGSREAKGIIDDIDRRSETIGNPPTIYPHTDIGCRIAIVPPFSGLR